MRGNRKAEKVYERETKAERARGKQGGREG